MNWCALGHRFTKVVVIQLPATFAGETSTSISCNTSLPSWESRNCPSCSTSIRSVEPGFCISCSTLRAGDLACAGVGCVATFLRVASRGQCGHHVISLRVGVGLRKLELVLQLPLPTPTRELPPPLPQASSRFCSTRRHLLPFHGLSPFPCPRFLPSPLSLDISARSKMGRYSWKNEQE